MRSRRKWVRKIAVSLIMVLCAISLYSNTAFADLFSGGHTSGYVIAYYSPSIASYGYTDMYFDAMYDWVYISDQVWMFWSTTDNNAYDKYTVENSSLTGLWGRMDPYKKFLWFYVPASLDDDTWAFCRVRVYDNQMDNSNFTTAERISTITHEIGHSLSLAHPSASHYCVMSQLRQGIGTQYYDRCELISKWGP